MRSATKMLILFAVMFAAMLAKCHDELTFLQDIHDIPQSDDLVFVDSGVTNDVKTFNLKGLDFKAAAGAVPDYDMYVLSIQWGSKNFIFAFLFWNVLIRSLSFVIVFEIVFFFL